MLKLFDALFGCSHKRYTFPISNRRGQRRLQVAEKTGTYVVCLDCGKEFPYDWQEMKMLYATPHPVMQESAPEIAKRAA
jgi:hypothetical protein